MHAHDYEFPAIDGGTIHLADYTGHCVLLVNTASECDTTPQYAGLQVLHERYAHRGLVVIGVPANDFGGQEPGDDPDIRRFCTERYGVTFPLAAKQKVTPPGEHPLYAALREELGEVAQPTWNFHKYLFDVDGALCELWDARAEPTDPAIIDEIEAALPG